MTAQDDPYVRVYYRVLGDDKFRGLSSSAWGHWVRLLTIADGMFPSAAPLPRWVERKPLAELVSARIVDLDGADNYRIHGMATERARRAEAATFAADVKHHGKEEALRRQAARAAASAAAASDRMQAQPPGLRADASPIRSAPLLSEPIHSDPIQSGVPTPPGSDEGSDDPEPRTPRLQRINGQWVDTDRGAA